GTAASPARPPVLILRDRRFGIRRTGKPAGLHALHVLCNSSSFLRLCGGICLGLLLRQLARMHHHKAERFERYSSVAVLDLHLSAHTLAMPAPGRLVLPPPGCLPQQGQGGLHAPPGFEFLPDRTRARDERDEIDLVLETYTQGTATIGFTIRDDATHPLQSQGQTLLNGSWGFHTITAVAIAQAHAHGYPPISAH